MDEDTLDVVEAVRRCSELADALAGLVLGRPAPPAPSPSGRPVVGAPGG